VTVTKLRELETLPPMVSSSEPDPEVGQMVTAVTCGVVPSVIAVGIVLAVPSESAPDVDSA